MSEMNNGISTPRPDPTILTTEQLRRELAALKEVLSARMDGMDKTHALLQIQVEKYDEENDVKRGTVKELFAEKFTGVAEKFHGIQVQFTERDIRSDKMELAQKEFAAAQAVAAGVANTVALSAQKEAAAAQSTFFAATMQERQNATTKQIDAIVVLLNSNTKATDDKITALSDRLVRSEGIERGGQESRTEARLSLGAVIGVVGAGVSIMALIVAIAFGIMRSTEERQATVVAPAIIPVQPAK